MTGPSCSWCPPTTARTSRTPRTVTCGWCCETLHDAVMAIETWAEDPMPSCRPVGPRQGDAAVSPRPELRRARPRPGPGHSGPRDRVACRRRRLGPAGAALRARRHRRSWSRTSRARRDDGPRRSRSGRVADPDRAGPGAGDQLLEEVLEQIAWPAGSPAAQPSSSDWCCRPTPTTRSPMTPRRPRSSPGRTPTGRRCASSPARPVRCHVLCTSVAGPRRRPVGRRRRRPGPRAARAAACHLDG